MPLIQLRAASDAGRAGRSPNSFLSVSNHMPPPNYRDGKDTNED